METKKIWQLMLVLTPLVGLAACSNDSGSTDSAVTTIAVDSTETTSGDPTTTVSDGRITVDVIVGENSSPDRVEEIPLGSEVTLNFTNPQADDEYHVHGYDLGEGITKKGETKTFSLTADKAGEYEVESHISETVLVILRVS
ncbi:unannotated protein [freshwater metagenome]|uniref:Unannotated protein n=1 Tax=freshwater metagenome TaxID=449393 RepID=A0A6J7UGN2_9ZZZZ|nr:hypothetical protein [Actinomycetota bacterium]MTH93244.1 hypothetical protein [Actinomycetota bacterium]